MPDDALETGPWTKYQTPKEPSVSSPSAPSGPWTRYQQPFQTEPSTTASGLAGSISRGATRELAFPLATAAAGSVVPGVGTVTGFGAGAGIELAAGLYNMVAPHLGLPKSVTPEDAADWIMDKIGIKRPQTGSERVAEATAGGLAGAITQTGLAGQAARTATAPLVKGTAEELAKQPVRQAVAGAGGGAAAQATAEAGGGPFAQMVASLAGGGLVGGRRAREPRPQAQAARDAGYVLPPSEITAKPGVVASTVAGWSGKIKTRQGASERNQLITNRLAAQSLGLPIDRQITEAAIEGVRQQAGQAYEAVKNAVPNITADADYAQALASIRREYAQAAQTFPTAMGHPEVDALLSELRGATSFATADGVQLVRKLRRDAVAELKTIGDPAKHELGLAKRQAADAIDALMDRNISQAGQPGVIDAYRRARTLIAKSYDVEGALNSATGDVTAHGLARLKARGRPLTGELDTIADTALAFPDATRPTAGFGHDEPLSALDFFGAVVSAAHGKYGAAATILGRPIARAGLLSQRAQRAITRPRLGPTWLPLLLNPGAAATVAPPSGDLSSYVDPTYGIIAGSQLTLPGAQ